MQLCGYDMVTDEKEGGVQTRLVHNGTEVPNAVTMVQRLIAVLCESAAELLRSTRPEPPAFGIYSASPCRV